MAVDAVTALGEDEIDSLLEAAIILLPALVANPTPVLVKGRRPIDFGLNFIDGRRILGDGKTWEGLITGTLAGGVLGAAAWYLLGVNLPLTLAFIIALGALLGDAAASFLKRRLGLRRGAPAPLLDQLDFYVGALAASHLSGYPWSTHTALAAAGLILLLHFTANVAAYLLGLKKEPW